jgi:hypothetical protein
LLACVRIFLFWEKNKIKKTTTCTYSMFLVSLINSPFQFELFISFFLLTAWPKKNKDKPSHSLEIDWKRFDVSNQDTREVKTTVLFKFNKTIARDAIDFCLLFKENISICICIDITTHRGVESPFSLMDSASVILELKTCHEN